ncbi:MAG: AAA family ATPase [Bacteroidales bacterium]|nr:AAA family ATPase [Bacteroidales bacterium]
MGTFKKGEKIGKFVVNSFIKKGAVAESYTVYGTDDMMYFLKIYDLALIPKSQLLEGKEVYEIVLCQEIDNDNIIHFVDKGEVKKDAKTFRYLVTKYYRGDLLVDSIKRDGVFGPEDAAQITLCVLNGLAYMHANALLHNDVRPSNIMLQELEDGMLLPTIIDLGHISYMVMGRPTFSVEDLAPFFRAPETFKGIYTPKTDIFSTGALLYFMLFGKAPWETDLEDCKGDKNLIKEAVKEAREQELILETEEVKLPDYMKVILQKALSKKASGRFESVVDFAKALADQVMPELAKEMEQSASEAAPAQEQMQQVPQVEITFKKGSGNGFENVTGRNELKEQLRKEVLFALQNPEKAQQYKLPAINGILLYGPPGCGKSLVLESFAEELGFNYSIIKASDFGNIYQPGVLENLQRLFDAAEIKAPFLICVDEIEFLVPGRGEEEVGITPQVAAFFALMNECSKKGVLIAATSNRPDLVEPSIMRVGCIDRVFFVPQPDFEARKDMFKSHLEGRPCEELDYDELAKMSNDFNAGDITETVNEAAMTAAYMGVPISQKILTDVLRFKNPTYSTNTKIGFNK